MHRKSNTILLHMLYLFINAVFFQLTSTKILPCAFKGREHWSPCAVVDIWFYLIAMLSASKQIQFVRFPPFEKRVEPEIMADIGCNEMKCFLVGNNYFMNIIGFACHFFLPDLEGPSSVCGADSMAWNTTHLHPKHCSFIWHLSPYSLWSNYICVSDVRTDSIESQWMFEIGDGSKMQVKY